jgi:hypothetical protein
VIGLRTASDLPAERYSLPHHSPFECADRGPEVPAAACTLCGLPRFLQCDRTTRSAVVEDHLRVESEIAKPMTQCVAAGVLGWHAVGDPEAN